VRAAQQAGAVGRSARERALLVAEQHRGRTIAAQRGAIDLHEVALDLVPGLLQLVHAPRQMRLACARGTREQDGRARAHGHALDLVDQRVEPGIARGDAALEKLHGLALLGAEALGDHVVARQVQVDQRIAARVAHALAPGWRGLGQHAGNAARLHQQEQADLCHVRARGDVRPVLLALGVEAVGLRPVEQPRIDLAEVPWIGNVHGHEVHLGLGRCRGDVALQQLRQGQMGRRVEQLQPLHHQILMLHEGEGRPPFFPAPRAPAGVQLRTQKADDDLFLFHVFV